MRLQGKTALIAGASRNIGRAIAQTYAREGADVILVARTMSEDLVQSANSCEALGVRALALSADISEHEQVNDMVATGLGHLGKVDVLVSCAAIRPHKPFWEIDYDEWHKVFAVNLHSTFYLASDDSAFVTGDRVICAGGRYM